MLLDYLTLCLERPQNPDYPRNVRTLRDYTICPCCKGTGIRKGFLGSILTCRVCRGAKVIRL